MNKNTQRRKAKDHEFIIMQHEPDYARIMANFHIKHADTAQVKAYLPTLVAELQKF